MSAAFTDALAPEGRLRVMINLGNPVLAQGTSTAPSGVTVEIAAALAAELEVPVEFRCVQAARDSVAAVGAGSADVGFLAIDPARASELAFSGPYVRIEGVYAVPVGSALTSPAAVDAPGVRVGVKEGSAYDLFLSRELRAAAVVRGVEGMTVFDELGLEAGAGIRQPVTAFVAGRPDLRLIPEAFMQIEQAVAVPRGREPEAVAWLAARVAAWVADGSVARWLAASGQDPGLAATGT